MIGPSAAVTSLPQNPSNPFQDIKYMYEERTSSCETVVPTIVNYNHVMSQEANGTFPSQVKEVRKGSQTIINGLLCDFTLIIQQVISQLQNDVSTCLQENGLNLTNMNKLLAVFSDPLKLYPFTRL